MSTTPKGHQQHYPQFGRAQELAGEAIRALDEHGANAVAIDPVEPGGEACPAAAPTCDHKSSRAR